MLEEITEQLEQLKNQKPIEKDSTLWVDATVYTKHIEYLQKQVEEANRKSDHWELEYYRK